MKLVKNISFILIVLAAVGCAKPDEESPTDVVPKSITDEPFRFDYNDERQILTPEEQPAPVFINDDEDDESGPTDQRK
jgi:hypothetical protein